MAYADLLQDDSAQQDFLVILRPRQRLTGWVNTTGFEYKVTFEPSEFINSLTSDGVAMTEVAVGSTLSAGEFYFDKANNEIHLRNQFSSDPSAEVTVVTFELFFAVNDSYFHKNPLDDSTEIVHFEAAVIQSPSIQQTMSDSLVGFLPVQRTSIRLANADRLFDSLVFSVSLNNSEIDIFHALRPKKSSPPLPDLEVGNIKRVISGLTGNISWQEDQVNIEILSRVADFGVEYRNETGNSFFDSTTFSALDPSFEGSAIRQVYGRVDGFVPVNIEFEDESPTTSDNRDWVVKESDSPNENSVSRTVQPGSTATSTILDDASGISSGDFVEGNRAVGSDEYFEVLTVSYGTNTITHAALGGGALASGDTVNRDWVARVEIEQNQVRYKAFPRRDYTVATFSGGTAGFSFDSSMESNISLPNTLSPSDRVFVRVYGKRNDVGFGGDDTDLAGLFNPWVIAYDLLVNKLGLGASQVDTSTFTTLATGEGNDNRLGFAIPENSTDMFPTFKTLFQSLINTILFRVFLNNDDEWTVSRLSPGKTVSKTITDDELTIGTIKYDFDYKDIVSDVIVKYNKREVSPTAGDVAPSSDTATAQSEVAKFLHEVNATREQESLHIEASDAQILANHLAFIFGERRGMVSIRTSDATFFDTLIADVVRIRRNAIPGFSFNADTLRDRDLSVIETSASLDEIDLTMDDEKGVEDNSSSW